MGKDDAGFLRNTKEHSNFGARDPVIRLVNRAVELSVAPEHGMTICSLRLRADGRNVLWTRPGAHALPASRRIGPAGSPSIDTFHDSLLGGWFEMSPHAGIPGTLDGQETMLHGEAPRLPWLVQNAQADAVDALVQCVRYPLVLRRRINVTGSRVSVESSISNTGTSACSITHGEHPCFSRKIFAGGSISADVRSARVLPPLDPLHAVLAPIDFQWPEARATDGRIVDLSSIPVIADGAQDHIALELASSEISIRTRDGIHIAISINLAEHPFMIFWRNHGAQTAPSFGQWDVFALEPQSTPGRSIDDAVEAGAITTLQPGVEMAYACSLAIFR